MTPKRPTSLDFLPDIDFEEILTNPILDIAARFWEADRYQAFRICYRSMRLIDDLVDFRKSEAKVINAEEIIQLKETMANWMFQMRGGQSDDEFGREFLDTLDKFKIPFWPWERLYRSMVYDLEYDGYSSILSFLRYSEGAAIAPASIFMHLCGIKKVDGEYNAPDFDIRKAARPLALFSYFVHIIRDFQKDHQSNLNYFADDRLRKYDLSIKELKEIASGADIPDKFRDLISEYKKTADYFRAKSRRLLDSMLPDFRPQYQLSLEMIYSLYLQIFERINPETGSFTGEELNPSPDEVKLRIEKTTDNFSPA